MRPLRTTTNEAPYERHDWVPQYESNGHLLLRCLRCKRQTFHLPADFPYACTGNAESHR